MNQFRFFIDPGHGGSDLGAVANGMRESEIVLEVSQHLATILQDSGIEVRLSRTTDATLTINQRWQEANQWGATHFVSVHANAGGGTGVETLIPTASPNNASRNLQENRRFAEIVSNAIARVFNMRVRRANGVMLETETRHGSIGVLRHTSMLAILPELAFIDSPISNPDVAILRNRRSELAQALAAGIFEFLGIDPQTKTASEPEAEASEQAEPQNQSFPVSESNIQAMINLGVMQSPEHWRTQNIEWLDQLLQNAAQSGKLDSRIDNGINSANEALKTLVDAQIITNADYWKMQISNPTTTQWLGQLIINIANRSRDILERIIWAEARGEDLRGQILVGNVIMNRHRARNFPSGIRNVVFQSGINSQGVKTYQFTPIANGAYARATPTDTQRQVVDEILRGTDTSQGATFFRGVRGMEGSWHANALQHLFDHGGHAFFRERH